MTEAAVHIRTDGTLEEVQPASGDRFTLEELQRYVGGYIERAYCLDGAPMWLNEDGIALGLRPNPFASTIVRDEYIPPGGLRGDVLVMRVELPDEEED